MSFLHSIQRIGWRRLATPIVAAGFLLPLSIAFAPPGRSSAKLPVTHYQLPASPLPNCTPNVVNYNLVYVRAPRYGDTNNSVWPDDVRPLQPDPGGQLRLLHPDCTDELLFPRPGTDNAIVDRPIGNGAVEDPNISFDGQSV